jgi:hypothetical protein
MNEDEIVLASHPVGFLVRPFFLLLRYLFESSYLITPQESKGTSERSPQESRDQPQQANACPQGATTIQGVRHQGSRRVGTGHPPQESKAAEAS